MIEKDWERFRQKFRLNFLCPIHQKAAFKESN